MWWFSAAEEDAANASEDAAADAWAGPVTDRPFYSSDNLTHNVIRSGMR